MLKNILENILTLKKKDNFFFRSRIVFFYIESENYCHSQFVCVFAREQKSNGNRIIIFVNGHCMRLKITNRDKYFRYKKYLYIEKKKKKKRAKKIIKSEKLFFYIINRYF